ncbi:MAG: alpha/beta hydrolase-fold protein [Candidatus Tectimicrobiota bacterium]
MAQALSIPLTIRVTASSVPAGGQVFVAGNQPSLGAWHPAGVALERQDDGAWVRTVLVDSAQPVELKVTLGAWATEALRDDGTVPSNLRLEVTAPRTLHVHVAQWKDTRCPPSDRGAGTLLWHRQLQGTGLKPRDVAVWLPPGYDTDPAQRYPVLYMHDGQNCFDPQTAAFGHAWQVDAEATRLIRAGVIEPLIIVAVWNTPDRRAEYGADPGLSAAYAQFLCATLKPLIDMTYRTKPTAAHTAVMGSSMGGLMAFVLAWDHPDIFAQAACLSPAFRHGDILARVGMATGGTPKPIRLYLDNGGVGLDAALQPGCDEMLALLRAQGYREGVHVAWFHEATAEHNEQAWAARVWRPLTFLFGVRAPEKPQSLE